MAHFRGGFFTAGHGDGTFQAPVSYLTSTQPYAIATGDFNGDGKLDLAVANYGGGGTLGCDPGGVAILLGNGNGTFSAGATFGAGKYSSHLAAADWNGDGMLDLVVATTGNDTTWSAGSFSGQRRRNLPERSPDLGWAEPPKSCGGRFQWGRLAESGVGRLPAQFPGGRWTALLGPLTRYHAG